MSVFAYTAMGKDGRMTSGTLTCDNRAAALSQIGRQGLLPVKIEEAKDAKAALRKAQAAIPANRVGKVSAKIVESFTRELANLLSGGVPLSRALSLLKREASNPVAKAMWTGIHDSVNGGKSLADALADYPRAFSPVYLAMIRAGEAGGFLDVVLNQIADFRTRESDLKGKVKAAMIYPCLLGFLAVAVVIFLLTFFIPQFKGIFDQFGANLPLLTQIIIYASNLVKHDGIIVAGVIFAIVIAIKRLASTKAGRRRIEMITLTAPLLGKVVSHFALVRFARMLGTLVGAGVPLVSSLKVAREAIGNEVLAETVSHAIEQVQRGEALSKALASCPTLFPPSVVEMVAVAEETARLDKELVRLAGTYEVDLDRQLRMLVSVAEPLMLFMMAGIIGTVVIGMLLPIFNLSDIVH